MSPQEALARFELAADAFARHLALYGVGVGDAGDEYDRLEQIRDDAAVEFAYAAMRERVFPLPTTAA